MNINYELLHAEGSATPIKGWVRGVPLEDQAHAQLRNIASHARSSGRGWR